MVIVDEMEFAELEILKSVQKFNFQEKLEPLNKNESEGHVILFKAWIWS